MYTSISVTYTVVSYFTNLVDALTNNIHYEYSFIYYTLEEIL